LVVYVKVFYPALTFILNNKGTKFTKEIHKVFMPCDLYMPINKKVTKAIIKPLL